MASRRVFEVLAELPERQRVATYLSHVEGMHHREIAELLGCAPATVAVHIHRAVNVLRGDPFVVAAPGQRDGRTPEHSKLKPPVAGWWAWLTWHIRHGGQALRQVCARVIAALLQLPGQAFEWFVRVLKTLSRRIGLLYPSTAIRVLYDTRPQLSPTSGIYTALRLAGPILLTQAALLVPRWMTRPPSVPPCTICGAGRLAVDGTYSCWCCRYRASRRPGLRLRAHGVLLRVGSRLHPARRPKQYHMLLDYARTELAALPRHQQPFYTAAVLCLLLFLDGTRFMYAHQQRRRRKRQPPLCTHCGAYHPRDDGTIGCWCNHYRPPETRRTQKGRLKGRP